MNWTKWSSIAEITSSIAIVLTLAYLAIQTQQNTEAINSQSRQSLFETGVLEQSFWIQYPELSEILVDNSLEMSFEQKIQLDSVLIVALSRRQFAWQQYEAGILDEQTWNQEIEIIALLLGTERARDWWNSFGKLSFPEGFIAICESAFMGMPVHPYWVGMINW